LQAQPQFAALLRGTLLPKDYRRLLLRLFGLHAPIEARIARHDGEVLMGWRKIGAVPGWPARLRSDLSFLGVDQAAIDDAPSAATLLPVLDNAAAALGCAWVVEGSALGGRVMSRRLNAILGTAGAGGAGTFLATQPGQSDRWIGCCAAVEACGADPRHHIDMRNAAVAVFDVFERWLTDPSCWAVSS
jgi:heme oxygenase